MSRGGLNTHRAGPDVCRPSLAALAAIMLVLLVLAAQPGTGTSVQGSGLANSTQALAPYQLQKGPHETSPGTELPMLKGAADLGSVPPTLPVYFTISFSTRNAGSLAELIAQQSMPGSPYYRHYLTLSQFEHMYGPTATVYGETEAYFESQGLTPVATGTTSTLAFTGTALRAGDAFGTHLDYYRLDNGSVVYANNSPLSLPSPIGNSISSVNGLTSLVKAKPMLMHRPLSASGFYAAKAFYSTQGQVYSTMATAVNFSSPGYLYTNESFPYGVTQFLNPSTLTAVYNATPLYRLGDSGRGSTIAVVMAAGYNPSDLASYSGLVFNNSSQILSRLSPYPVNGGTSNASYPGSAFLTSGDAFEFTLDIEYAATMAPSAHLDAVYGPSLSIASLVTAYAKLTTLAPVPNVITNSWGGWEDTWWNLYGPSWQSGAALENYFMELTSMGATIVAASGDRGGFDPYSGLLSPSFPASSPYVVAVGGTRTTALNGTGVAFPSPGQYLVNETVAPFGYSEVQSQPSWIPDYPLNGSAAGGTAAETYWYYGTGSSPDVASGGIGLSYWFEQPWWQHGPQVTDSGRRMIADVAAAADFNETVYFAGAWNFFWGGTSFAAPVFAGEIALIDTYLNSTTGNTSGRSSYYIGNALPLLYRIGSDGHLQHTAFRQISSGNNQWDSNASMQGLGWPSDQNWSTGWASASGGWNMLAGWGVPDVYNLAADANALLNPAGPADQNVVTLNGSVPYSLNASQTFTFSLTSQNGSLISGAIVNLTFLPAGGSPLYQQETTSVQGTFSFRDGGRSGELEIYTISSTGGSGFQPVWISDANLTSGKLEVSVLGTSSVMGGFDFFNGFASPQYPALDPLMPNTVAVRVLYVPSLQSSPLPVYDAQVTAQAPIEPYFSSPPSYPNLYYNSTLNGTTLRSTGWTDMNGIAYVETWNVAETQAYFINVSYLGLNAGTTLNVTPRYVIQSTNAFSSTYAAAYGNQPGYIGLGAENTIIAPGAEGGAAYTLPVRVTDWKGHALAGVMVDAAMIMPQSVLPIPSTATWTDSAGIAFMTIDSSLTMDSLEGNGLLLVQAFNGSYSSSQIQAVNGTAGLPVLTNDSCALLELLQPVFGEVQTIMDVNGLVTSTPYVGTANASASFYVGTPLMSGFSRYDNLTYIKYAVDNSTPYSVPLPTVGQEEFFWSFALPPLSLGHHIITVSFGDTLGFGYEMQYDFSVIGQGVNPPPAVSIISPSDGSYVTGTTTVSFSTQEAGYLLSEILSIGQVTFNVLGMNSFKFNASAFGYGEIPVTLQAVNLNGVSSTSFIVLHGTPQPVPAALITSPSDYSAFQESDTVTVGLQYSGDYLSSEMMSVRGPGANYTINTTGVNSVLLKGLRSGDYLLTYTVTSADGRNAFAVVHFSVIPSPSGNFASWMYVSYLSVLLIAVAIAGGVAVGIAIDRFMMRKRP